MLRHLRPWLGGLVLASLVLTGCTSVHATASPSTLPPQTSASPTTGDTVNGTPGPLDDSVAPSSQQCLAQTATYMVATMPADFTPNAVTAYNYLRAHCLGPVPSGMLVASMMAESGVEPRLEEGGQLVEKPTAHGGFGIMMWTGDRKVGLTAWAHARHQAVTSLAVQLDFLWHELGILPTATGNITVLTALRQQTAAIPALNVILFDYERYPFPCDLHTAMAGDAKACDPSITQRIAVGENLAGTLH